MTTTQPLVSIETVIAQARGKAAAAGRELDPTYSWTAEAMADNLLDNDEQVYTWRGIGLVYLITEDLAAKLLEYTTDFTIERSAAK